MDEYVVADYIRLSSEDTRNDSMSIENQRLMIGKYIADMDVPNIRVLEFVDNGYSGTNFERPAVQELLDLVRSGKINCIVVKDFSRFGRNAIETGYFLERVFPLYQTRFISICDFYDSAKHEGSTGGIEVALKFLLHEHYSRDLSKKIKAAKHEKARRGESLSKNCVFGYRKTSDNRLEIDTDAAKIVRHIFKLYSEGNSLTDITRELYEQECTKPSVYKNRKHREQQNTDYDCVWEKSIILKILRDEQYIGTYVAGKSVTLEVGSGRQKKKPDSEWIRIPGHHPAIVSNELFEKVNAVIGAKGEPLRRRELSTDKRYATVRQSPLKGKVICGCCGHSMALSTTKNSVFHCTFSRSASGAACHGLHIPKSELEYTLFELILKQTQIVLNVDSMNDVSAVKIHTARQSECKRQIKKAENMKRSLYERFILGEIQTAEYMSRKTEIDLDIDRFNRAYATLSEQLSKEQSAADNNMKLREVVSCENGLSQPIVDLLVDKVRVYPDNRIEIEWKIADLFSTEIEPK